MRVSFATMPFTQFLLNEREASARRRIDWSRLRIITGLKTFNSKCPLDPATLIATLLPMTCAQTMVMASHCVGLTLPGMMDEPGSFSGNDNSPRPQRGPEPRNRISFAIFISETATVFNAPDASTIASCAARASNCRRQKVRGCTFEIVQASRHKPCSVQP